MLNGWLSPPEGKWKLPFPGSRDGFQAETFHSKRDNKGPTVTIVTVITFLEDSPKYRGTVSMLVVTKLNNGSFGRIKRHKYAFLVEGF